MPSHWLVRLRHHNHYLDSFFQSFTTSQRLVTLVVPVVHDVTSLCRTQCVGCLRRQNTRSYSLLQLSITSQRSVALVVVFYDVTLLGQTCCSRSLPLERIWSSVVTFQHCLASFWRQTSKPHETWAPRFSTGSFQKCNLDQQPCSLCSWIPWNLSFRYIRCTGQFTPKMKVNAELRLLSSLVWIDSGVVVSQHRLESFFMK